MDDRRSHSQKRHRRSKDAPHGSRIYTGSPGGQVKNRPHHRVAAEGFLEEKQMRGRSRERKDNKKKNKLPEQAIYDDDVYRHETSISERQGKGKKRKMSPTSDE